MRAWVIVAALWGVPSGSPPGGPRITASSTVTATATVGDDLDALLDEAPLSDEELALLAALDEPTETATSTPEVAPWGRPEVRSGSRTIDGARLHETGARSVAEALRAQPILRGHYRLGLLSALTVNGALIESARARALWRRSDPFIFERAVTRPGLDRARTSDNWGGTIALESRPARDRAHLGAGLVLRSADRGGALQADVGAGGPRAGVRGFAVIGLDDDLRIQGADGTEILDEDGPRIAAGLDARFRPADVLRVSTQALFTFEKGATGLHPTMSLVRPAQDVWGVLATAQAELGGPGLGARMVLGFDRAHFEGDGTTRDEQGWQLALQSHYALASWVTVGADGLLALSHADDERLMVPATGERRHLAGGLWGRADFGPADLDLRLRVAHLATTAGAGEGSATELLPQAVLHVEISGPLGLRLSAGRDLELAPPGDQLDTFIEPAESFGPRRTWRFEGGPTLRSERAWLDVTGLLAWLDGPLRAGLADRTIRVWGLEVEGGAQLMRGLHLAFAAGWEEGQTSDNSTPIAAWPGLRAHAALRYEIPARNAYVEIRGRAVTSAWEIGTRDPNAAEDFFFVRGGVAGGVDLGSGVRLELTVDNALDRRVRALESFAPEPGVDLRARLTWAH